MILTGTQVRPGQIINQNFHVNRLRPANVVSNYFRQIYLVIDLKDQ